MNGKELFQTLGTSITPILVGVTLYFMQGVNTTVQQDHDMIVRLDEWRKVSEERTARLESADLDLYARTDDRYHRSDAIEDFAKRDQRITKLETRVDMIANTIEKHVDN